MSAPRHHRVLPLVLREQVGSGRKTSAGLASRTDQWGYGRQRNNQVAKRSGKNPYIMSSRSQMSMLINIFPFFMLQIVIQLGDELRDGSVLIRTAENRQGLCPINFLQEV